MDAVIYNITDLKNEIERLKIAKQEQEIVLKSHFSSPSAIFHTVTSFFKGSSTTENAGGLFGNQDIVSLVSRFVVPFILNKTIFRSSNFIIKAAVGLLSQKASGFINENSVVSLWDKIKSIIPRKKNKSQKKAVTADYGIPPYSESY
ncbi:hypothetical protein [Mucilaginibacter paludis]|uniref:Uncharacterized protein n=1 Tax=Mucilaginibacter paludis DSM 18603 TaxID=714943 RepID=H1Y2F8_9SPHI|nr:hypothetical protein [Mucilaginibacter paludis]EHQ28006.1 hypothetical protein Mucpa_3914 [Mucilaginibacter paludis DSM 18603]